MDIDEDAEAMKQKIDRERSLALEQTTNTSSWPKWCLFAVVAFVMVIASLVVPKPSLLTAPSTQAATSSDASVPSYSAQFTSTKPALDGSLSGPWVNAAATSSFVDIVGSGPAPRYTTTTMMLWDNDYLYIGARIQDRDVWCTMSTRNSPLYQQNNFEFFIDPDFDGLNYYEFEINPLGTTWQLSLDKPYNQGGVATDPNEIGGVLSNVQVQGTLNKVGDVDQGWTVEIAIPWSGVSRYNTKKQGVPNNGDSFRVQFARTAWGFSVDASGSYVKSSQSNISVWSGMNGGTTVHDPTLWGTVSFVGKSDPVPSPIPSSLSPASSTGPSHTAVATVMPAPSKTSDATSTLSEVVSSVITARFGLLLLLAISLTF
ncbi:UNVERIFIED_CONTAM: hypothetical protein HDU68_003365 [Siphonaria sp. JEL0065]|nr:hypothetical protein HDU68_003365 [Siphonaria sp. JEL0065]